MSITESPSDTEHGPTTDLKAEFDADFEADDVSVENAALTHTSPTCMNCFTVSCICW